MAAFQSRVTWYFSFWDIFFSFTDIRAFLLCKFSHLTRHRLCKYNFKNISANKETMLLKLSRDVKPYKIYQVLYISIFLWQHARFLSTASSKFNITICGCTGHKKQLKILKRRPNERGTGISLKKDKVFRVVVIQFRDFCKRSPKTN